MSRTVPPALLLLVALVCGCAACGIRPTGVVAAGAPATGVSVPDQYFYFVVGDRVEPLGAPPELGLPNAPGGPPVEYEGRPTVTQQRQAALRGIGVLLAGASTYLRENRVGTAIPEGTAFAGRLEVSDTRVEVVLFGPPTLNRTALVQIGCTVHSGMNLGPATWDGDVSVILPDRRLAAPCPPEVRDALPFPLQIVPGG